MLGLVAVFFVLQTVGIIGGGGGDHDVDGDGTLDHDADVDHDVDASAAWHDALAFFGVGHVPFMVVWVTLFLFSGFCGIFLNRVFIVRAGGSYAGWFFAVVMVCSLLVGLAGVRLFSRLAGKLVDTGGRGSTKKHELAGKVGVVASPSLDEKHGEVRVHDDRGNELLVHGRLSAGEPRLAYQAKVVLVDFDADKELFWVAAVPELDRKG